MTAVGDARKRHQEAADHPTQEAPGVGLSEEERDALFTWTWTVHPLTWLESETVEAAVERIVAARVAEVRADERRRCVEAIVQAAPPLNSELLYDGREDPTAAAYVEGFKDAWSAVSDLSDERVDDRERDRRVKAEVWREGFHAGRNADHNSSWWPPNPYRERAADLRGGES